MKLEPDARREDGAEELLKASEQLSAEAPGGQVMSNKGGRGGM
jgi:hypothetical protein